jgi:tRNA modification GTPase
VLLRERLVHDNRPLLVVVTKTDLEESRSTAADFSVSARTGAGLTGLLEAAAERLTSQAAGNRQFVGMTAARARESLTGAITALLDAERAAASGAGDEIVAISIREALDHLGAILGTIYTDDVLDRIFSRFCIGK